MFWSHSSRFLCSSATKKDPVEYPPVTVTADLLISLFFRFHCYQFRLCRTQEQPETAWLFRVSRCHAGINSTPLPNVCDNFAASHVIRCAFRFLQGNVRKYYPLPVDAGASAFPYPAPGRSYNTVSDLAQQIISRFLNSSTRPVTGFLGYQLSHRRMTWLHGPSAAMTERTISAASSSLESSFVHSSKSSILFYHTAHFKTKLTFFTT